MARVNRHPDEASTASVFCLVLSVVATCSWFTCCCMPAVGLAIPAVLCGHVAWKECGSHPRKQGRAVIIAGLIIGYFNIVVAIQLLGLIFCAILGLWS